MLSQRSDCLYNVVQISMQTMQTILHCAPGSDSHHSIHHERMKKLQWVSILFCNILSVFPQTLLAMLQLWLQGIIFSSIHAGSTTRQQLPNADDRFIHANFSWVWGLKHRCVCPESLVHQHPCCHDSDTLKKNSVPLSRQFTGHIIPAMLYLGSYTTHWCVSLEHHPCCVIINLSKPCDFFLQCSVC